MKLCGIYMIEHTATGRRYIGKSVDVDHRIAQHFCPGQSNVSASYIHAAIKKHGREAFTVRLLELCSGDATARVREVQLIKELNTRAPYGFNLTDGGDGTAGLRPSAETRARQSASRTGRKHSAETRAKMSAWQVGRVQSEETKAKVRAANTGNKYSVGRVASEETKAKIRAGNTGKTVSAETKAKISASLKGRLFSAETRAKISAAKRRHASETEKIS